MISQPWLGLTSSVSAVERVDLLIATVSHHALRPRIRHRAAKQTHAHHVLHLVPHGLRGGDTRVLEPHVNESITVVCSHSPTFMYDKNIGLRILTRCYSSNHFVTSQLM